MVAISVSVHKKSLIVALLCLSASLVHCHVDTISYEYLHIIFGNTIIQIFGNFNFFKFLLNFIILIIITLKHVHLYHFVVFYQSYSVYYGLNVFPPKNNYIKTPTHPF